MKYWNFFLSFLLIVFIAVACSGKDGNALEESYTTLTISSSGAATVLGAGVTYDSEILRYAGVLGLQDDVLVNATANDGKVSLSVVSEHINQGELATLVFKTKNSNVTATLDTLKAINASGEELSLNVQTNTVWQTGLANNPLDRGAAGNVEPLKYDWIKPYNINPKLDTSFVNYHLGDLNQDNQVNLNDYYFLIFAFLEDTLGSFTDYQYYHADMNGDFVIDEEDAWILLQKAIWENQPAKLVVSPKELNLDANNPTGLILIGNMGNQPLPNITKQFDPSNLPVVLKDVTPSGAVGMAYEVTTNSMGNGQLLFNTESVAIKSTFPPDTKVIDLIQGIAQNFNGDPDSLNDVNKVRELDLTAIPALLDLLKDDDDLVVWIATYALNGLLTEENLDQVENMFAESDPQVLKRLAVGLNKDKNLTVRVLIAATLLRLGDDRGVNFLKQAVGSQEVMSYSHPPQPISVFVARVLEEFGLAQSATLETQETTVSDGVKGSSAIKVEVKIEFHGSGVTKSLISKWEKGIESNWQTSKQYKGCDVSISAIVRSRGSGATPTSGYHQVFVHKLKKGEYKRSFISALPSSSNGSWKSTTGEWNNNDSGWVAAHEAGHLMGLKDEYKDDANGKSIPTNPGSIMAEYNATRIDQAHIDRLVGETGAKCDPPPEPCEGSNAADCDDGSSNGDPHFRTFDGLSYDFQGYGEYVLIESTQDDFVIQARQLPWGNRDDVTLNAAIAANLRGDRAGIYINNSPPLMVNGKETILSDGETLNLPNGGRIRFSGGIYSFIWPDGSRIDNTFRGDFVEVSVVIPPSRSGKVHGLLGNDDGDTANDLATRDGNTTLSMRPNQQDLYKIYGDSWRISQNESLFDYGLGEDTETYTNRNFPISIVTVDDLDPALRQQARQQCRDAGVTNEILLDNCTLDVALTGNTAFIDGYIDAKAPTEQVIPNKSPNVSFTVNPNNGSNLTNFSFDASGSNDPDGTITSYDWDFGDGATGIGKTATHKYAADGTYKVKLTVTDNEGAENSTTKNIKVANLSPKAVFTVNPQKGSTSTEFGFDASTSNDPDGTITSYDWDFGDGATGIGKTATHKYAADGTYKVELIVIDNEGLTDAITREVIVKTVVKEVNLIDAMSSGFAPKEGNFVLTISPKDEHGNVLLESFDNSNFSLGPILAQLKLVPSYRTIGKAEVQSVNVTQGQVNITVHVEFDTPPQLLSKLEYIVSGVLTTSIGVTSVDTPFSFTATLPYVR